MPKIQTVCGPIDSAELGSTLMHEHILVSDLVMRYNFSDWFNADEFIPHAKMLIGRAKERGVKTIVDATPVDLGRDIDLIRRVAETAEIQIIASTGFYCNEHRYLADSAPEYLAELMIGELEHGIRDTGVRPGIIKCASDGALTPVNKQVLRAAALASLATGTPITTHATNGTPLAQALFLLEQGVPAHKIVIGHCGDCNDVPYLEQVLQTGCYIGMDRFGLDQYMPLHERVGTLVQLWKKGYLGQMVLSHDFSLFIDTPDYAKNIHSAWTIFKNRDWSRQAFQLTYLADVAFPALKEQGMTDGDINRMMCGNPRSYFEQAYQTAEE
ncbi:MAG: phosphotriesterase [Eubacteriales bacterium]|nr:phosphotriesterase [Eubacteriales bacterium]